MVLGCGLDEPGVAAGAAAGAGLGVGSTVFVLFSPEAGLVLSFGQKPLLSTKVVSLGFQFLADITSVPSGEAP